jgi:putative ABC transport system permease protein
MVLLEVDFSFNPFTLALVELGAVLITGFLGAMTISRVLAMRPAHLLRQLGVD